MNDQPIYLAHHGVKGMHWGVWNSETARKYGAGAGRAVGKTAKGVARATGRAVAVTLKKTGSAVYKAGSATVKAGGKAKAAYSEHRRKEGIEAIRKGDAATVKKNMKYMTAEDIHSTLAQMDAEKRLMSEISARQKKTGLDAVANAISDFGDSPTGRSLKKGVNEGLQKVTETAVKTAGGPAGAAVGNGAAAAFAAYAMYKMDPSKGFPDLGKAFKSGVQTSLTKAAKEQFGFNTPAGESPQVFKPYQEANGPKQTVEVPKGKRKEWEAQQIHDNFTPKEYDKGSFNLNKLYPDIVKDGKNKTGTASAGIKSGGKEYVSAEKHKDAMSKARAKADFYRRGYEGGSGGKSLSEADYQDYLKKQYELALNKNR